MTSSMQSVGGQKVGLVRIKQFSTSTAEDVKAALAQVRSQGAKQLLLDLVAVRAKAEELHGVDSHKVELSSAQIEQAVAAMGDKGPVHWGEKRAPLSPSRRPPPMMRE